MRHSSPPTQDEVEKGLPALTGYDLDDSLLNTWEDSIDGAGDLTPAENMIVDEEWD